MTFKSKSFKIIMGTILGLFVLILVIGVTGGDDDSAESKDPETPEEHAEKIVNEIFGEENIFYEDESSINEINYDEEDKHLSVSVFSSSNVSNEHIKDNALYNMADTLEALDEVGSITSVDFEILYPLQDEYGEQTDRPITTAVFTKETLDKIVWENFVGTRIPDAADEYWYHPTLD